MNDKEIEAAFEKLYKPPKRETYSGIRKEVWETKLFSWLYANAYKIDLYVIAYRVIRK